ncbi:MAG: helix-turn-helix domain-containing protein [Christensenellales bacterium]
MSIGDLIRELRKKQGLTIKDISIMANVTSSLISQIENDKANPSLATLIAIAAALNTDLSSLFHSIKSNGNGPVVRANHGFILHNSEKWTRISLTDIDLKKFSVQIVQMREGADTDAYPELNPHEVAAYEFGYVLSGKLLVTLEDKPYVLNPGDSISFHASSKHSLRNLLATETVLLWILIFT